MLSILQQKQICTVHHLNPPLSDNAVLYSCDVIAEQEVSGFPSEKGIP